MARGAKPGERRGGRTKGTPNKRTAALEEAVQLEAQVLAEALGEDCFPGDAHALLLAVYKDKRNPVELRVDAAKAALPYEKPRLQSVDHGVKPGAGRVTFKMELDG